MSVIIRLQNLAWSANASDIREFFKGLNVPEGGVHIVGGEMGDAFIAFSTDEDARLGMMKTGECLKGVQVTLNLSSRTQMQKIIEAARLQVMAPAYSSPAQPAPAPVPVQESLSFNPPIQQVPHGMPHNQPQIQPEPKPDLSMYRNEASPMHNFSQKQFPNQGPQYSNQGPQYSNQGPQYSNQGPQHPNQGPQHPNQGPQNPSMFPGAAAVKPNENGSDNYHVRPGGAAMQPSQQVIGQYHTPQGAQPVATPKPTYEDKEKTQAPITDKSDSDRRDRRSDRDKKDRDSRDDRRRRSKSRSRSRERRRRHRSRSRDRSSRYRRSRSRDRDRGKDKDRRERDRRPSHHRDVRSQESSENKSSVAQKEGIPGLGEIPANIPKDKVTLVTDSSKEPAPRTTQSRWSSDFNATKDQDARQPVDMEIEPVDMDLEKAPQGRHQSPQISQQTPLMQRSPANMYMPPGSDRKPPPQGRQPLLQNFPYPPPNQDRMPGPQENISNPAQNGRAGLLEPPKLDSDGIFEGPRFSNPRDQHPRDQHPRDQHPRDQHPRDQHPRSPERPDDRSFQSDRRSYGPSFGDMNKRNGPGGEIPYPERDNWSQGNEQAMRPNRPGNSINNREYDRPPVQSNFGGPPNDRPGEREPWNDGGSGRDPQGSFGWSSRGGRGRFNDQEFFRGSDHANSYDQGPGRSAFDEGRPSRGRRGMGREPGRSFDSRYDQRFGEYQQDGDNFRNAGGRGGSFRGRGYGGPEGIRDRRPPRTTSIEIRNVPHGASYKAIREVFYGISLPSSTIKILPDGDGRRSTTALMRFANTADATEAFQRRGSYIGDSQIVINFVDEARYDNSVNFEQSEGPPRRKYPGESPVASSAIKIMELPNACTESDIGQMFGEFRIGNIVMERSQDSGAHPRSAYVRFSNPEEGEAALRKLRGVTLDGNFLRGEMCSERVFMDALETNQRQPTLGDGNNPPSQDPLLVNSNPVRATEEPNKSETRSAGRPGVDLLTDSVVIKQVPCDLSKSSIHDFFSDEGIVPEKVYFGEANSDKLCDAYVVFPQVENASKAVLKTGQILGPVKAIIELISKPTVMRTLGLPFDPLELFNKSNKSNMAEISKGSSSRDNQGSRKPTGHAERPPMENRQFQPPLKPTERQPPDSVNDRHPRERPEYPGRPSYQPEPAPRSVPNSVAPDCFGRPGTVVALGNVPYGAGTDDILEFFRGFQNITPDCVIRRYDEMNRPTADARVAMTSHDEAMRAVSTLNKQYIKGRAIFVSHIK